MPRLDDVRDGVGHRSAEAVTFAEEPLLVCAQCGRLFERPRRIGPIPKYCSAAHRQRAYEARRYEAAIRAAYQRGLDERR